MPGTGIPGRSPDPKTTMSIHRALLLLAAAAMATTSAAAQQPLPIDQDPRQVAQRLDEHMRRLVPFNYSGSLLVARGGEIVLASGYGLADRENGVPVTAETVFDLAAGFRPPVARRPCGTAAPDARRR